MRNPSTVTLHPCALGLLLLNFVQEQVLQCSVHQTCKVHARCVKLTPTPRSHWPFPPPPPQTIINETLLMSSYYHRIWLLTHLTVNSMLFIIICMPLFCSDSWMCHACILLSQVGQFTVPSFICPRALRETGYCWVSSRASFTRILSHMSCVKGNLPITFKQSGLLFKAG